MSFTKILFLAAALCLGGVDALRAAEAPVRVAIGPYFAPSQDASLRTMADALPELLAAELSGHTRFQLVERAQINAAVKELNLSAEGFTSSDSVLKLGKLLGADWLISGSIAPLQTSTQIWTRIIDMRTGVLLDVESTALSSDTASSLARVGAFVTKTNRSGSSERQFVALGPFRDFTMLIGPPDSSREVQDIVERQFRNLGFGIVEREAIWMLGQEVNLAKSPLLTPTTNRMKLQAAFWLVDGGSQWLDTSGTNLMISLRLEKVGRPEVLLRFTNAPGAALEQMMANRIAATLQNASVDSNASSTTAEGKVQAARGFQVTRKENVHADPGYFNSPRARAPEAQKNWRRDALSIAIQRYETALILNPEDLESKLMLGRALLESRATAQRGNQMLWELVGKTEGKVSERALNYLAMDELADKEPNSDSRLSYRTEDLEPQITLLKNDADLDAKLKLGRSLISYATEKNRQRGALYLTEVASSSRKDLVPLAESALTGYRGPRPVLSSTREPVAGSADRSDSGALGQYRSALKYLENDQSGDSDLQVASVILSNIVRSADEEFSERAKHGLERIKAMRLGNELVSALMTNNERAAYELIQKGAYLEMRAPMGYTPLILASVSNNLGLVKVLVSAGANVTNGSKSTAGSTALHFATQHKDPALMAYLLERGAPVDLRSKRGDTPLFAAIANKYPAAAEFLLTKGADPNLFSSRDDKGRDYSPLMAVVVINPDVSLIDLLLKHGADLDRQSNAGRTALMEAATREGTLVVSYLLAKGANVNIKAPSGHTALILAAYNGRLETAKLLLSAGADPSATATDSRDPNDQVGRYDATGLALQQGHAEVAKLIETAKTRRANDAR